MASVLNFSLKSPIKLVNLSRNIDVVTFPNGLQGKAIFSEQYKHIELIMKNLGVTIPLEERHNFPSLKKDQRKITLEDQNFGIAFYTLYYKRGMNPQDFQWQPLSS